MASLKAVTAGFELALARGVKARGLHVGASGVRNGLVRQTLIDSTMRKRASPLIMRA